MEPEDDQFFDDDYDDDPEDDGFEDCGMTDEGLCMYAGSEWCDFECPFNR